MKISKIPTDDGYYFVVDSGNVENVNPIDHYSELYIEPKILLQKDLILSQEPNLNEVAVTNFLRNKLNSEWVEHLEKQLKDNIPHPNFKALLSSESKKDQMRLLENQALSPTQLNSFIIKSYLDQGYKYSHFKSEHLHNGLKDADLPSLIEVKEGKVNKVGQTNLTDGQLKQIIEHRKFVIAHIIDNGNNWHCFFLTMKSINRGEKWKDGKPHLHYISDKFGMQKNEVIDSLKSKYYKLNSLPHIELIGY